MLFNLDVVLSGMYWGKSFALNIRIIEQLNFEIKKSELKLK